MNGRVPVFPIVIFAILEVAANVSASKLVTIGTLSAPAGVFTIALAYVALDLILQVGGTKMARRVRWQVLVGALLAAAYFQLAIQLPSASFWHNQAAFASTLGTTLRITLASAAAYAVATSVDIAGFSWLNTRVEPYWRVLYSGVVTLLLDTVTFILLAFSGTGSPLGQLILGQYLLKLSCLVVAAPCIYLARWLYKVPISLKEVRLAADSSTQ